jgi:Putative zinc-binding metallo-peptidase
MTGGRSRTTRRGRKRLWWAELDDEALLDLRFRDLGLTLEQSPLEPALARLDRELDRRGFRFRPHHWLSEEWFCPDGVPGFAIPFYLAHPRLARLERHLMHEVEGGNARWLARILRHETGHALDNAYRLHRRERWRVVFGRASRAYPTRYAPRITSRNYVMHLGHWYAQSHPTEDFAETFAVWMAPNSTWRTDYETWHALRKLRYVDELMQEIRDRPAPVRSRRLVEPLSRNSRTLREHYADKLGLHDREEASRYDRRLRLVFGLRYEHPGREPAATFIRRVRPQLQRLLVRRSHLHPYLVHHVMRMVIKRAHTLDLVVTGPLRVTERALFGLLERMLFDLLRRGRERFTL